MKDDIIYFALCPHVKDKELSHWQEIALKISKLIKKEVKLITFNNFDEINSEKEFYHIIYANPDVAMKYLTKAYIPIAYLQDERESLCSITSRSYSPEKESIKVALINQKYFFLPLLLHKNEFKRFNLIFVNSYEEIINLLKENKADIGFVYTSLKDSFQFEEGINFSLDFCFPISHIILIHPCLEKYKEELISIDDFKKISSSEIDNLKSLYNQLDIMLRDWAYHDISEAMVNSPNMGIVIYHKKILFFNEYARSLLGYSEDEFLKMDSYEFVYSEDRVKVIQNIERRLMGEKFFATYDIRFQRKDGSVVFVECFTNTILFRGLYCGLVVFYDITSRKYAEKFKEMLMQVNKIITKSFTEEDIYESICKAFVEKLDVKFIWLGILDEKNEIILPVYHYGDDRGLLEVFDFNISKNKSLTEKAIFNGEIIINQDSRCYEKEISSNYEPIEKKFNSSCTIPLKKFGKVVALLRIYSEIPYFFNESSIDILKEIQDDLSFALERVERIRHNTIISEALKNSDTWILITDEKGDIIYVNEAVERISGYSREELIGKNPRIFKSGLNPPEFYKEMWDTILAGKIFRSITPNRKKSGEIFHGDLKIIPVKLPGNIIRFVAVAKDVTEEIMLSERVQRLQNFDSLTGLLNMNGFAANVSQSLSKKTGFALLILIDIYNMSYINKMYGIYTGDMVLKNFASKIKEVFENTEIVARIGADTFGVYMVANSSEEIYKIYSKLYELNRFSINLNNNLISISINAAIAVHPKDGEDFKTLYERADITLQQAKKSGAGVYQFFNSDIEREAEKLWEVFALIKRARDEKLFNFYYQPYFNAKTLEVEGFESLVRIIDRDGKLYTPDFFIDYLENSQYLKDFENWALGEVIKKIKEWNKNVSLNISGKTFSSPVFLTILQSIPSEFLEKMTIEITERVFIENPEYTIQILRDIKHLKNPPKIAVDDFGTGYSSMIYLRDLPIDILKIDRSFTKDMIKDRKSLAIVQTIIELSKKLGIITLAEGVETHEQFDLLRSMGCDYVQGYLFSKPVPEKEISKFLA